jgi:hypothetical protein
MLSPYSINAPWYRTWRHHTCLLERNFKRLSRMSQRRSFEGPVPTLLVHRIDDSTSPKSNGGYRYSAYYGRQGRRRLSALYRVVDDLRVYCCYRR